MREWDFTLIVDGDVMDEVVLDKLAEQGADDATFGVADGVAYADFSREAASFRAAVFSAIRDLESVPGVLVLRIEPDDLVTMAEIAQRLERTRESVRLLAMGHRGQGTFPPPISHLRARSKLWRWSDVARWAGLLSEEDERNTRLVGALNAALELRRLHGTLAAAEEEEDFQAASSLAALALAGDLR
jgi:predicted acylesterase/phospholipase RssA